MIFVKIDAGKAMIFFLIGVHEITLARVPSNCITFERKERLGKVYVLRHTFAVLLCCATLPLQIFQTSCSTLAFCSLRKRCEEYRLSLLHSLNMTAPVLQIGYTIINL
jgi:hypothetical protein